MKKWISALLVAVSLVVCSSNLYAAVLIYSPNGKLVKNASVTTLAQAATSPLCAGKKIVFTTDQTLTANLTWPADRYFAPENGAKIVHGTYDISYAADTSSWPRVQLFSGTGKVLFPRGPGRGIYLEWYGGKADTDYAAGTGTDCTAAWVQAIKSSTESGNGITDVAIYPILLGGGNYGSSNIVLPPASVITGEGSSVTNLVARPGTTGIFITDSGNAAKIIIKELTVYHRFEPGIVGGIWLGVDGYTRADGQSGDSGVTDHIQHGTNGYLRNLVVAGLPDTATGVNIDGNVGWYENISGGGGTGIKIIGNGNFGLHLMPYGNGNTSTLNDKGAWSGATSYVQFDTVTYNGVKYAAKTAHTNIAPDAATGWLNWQPFYALYFDSGTLQGVEIEAPGDGCIPALITGNVSAQGFIVSLDNDDITPITHPHLVEFGINSGTWDISGFLVYNSAGNTITNGNFKRSDGSYFGGNSTTGSLGNGNYSSSTQGQVPTYFTLRVVNTGGTLQHRITSVTGTGTPSNLSRISGAANALINTPTGSDTDVGITFANGGKISSVTTSAFVFNSGAQSATRYIGMAMIATQTTGTDYTVVPTVISTTVANVTLARLAFTLTDSLTGASIPWATALAAPGALIDVQFSGYLQ
jgi:hypothetical protein